MEIFDYLKLMVKYEASDLYFTVGAPVSARIEGILKPLEKNTLPAGRVKTLAYTLMGEDQIAQFELKPEMNLAHSLAGVGRFRVNVFKQRNQTAMVIRHIKTHIPSPEELGLPPILKKFVMQKRGLILFIGGTGSGKSTSLAALIDHRNACSAGHIITIEDPIEFIHQHKKSIINQREVGLDTDCYEDALINTLRQAPDVILIGEIRSRETMEHAIAFAETGHLAISTLHANNSNQALDRIINFFPDDRRNQLLMDLSLNVRAFISQRLVPSITGKRVVAVEVMLGTPLILDLILKGDIHGIKEVMEKSTNLGMQTFDQSLYKLYKNGDITIEEALRNADSQNNLRLKISLSEGMPEVDPSLKIEEILDDDTLQPPGVLNMGLEPK
ncbi:MAG: PilT/PilU family type 4a pilus ATPase [Gammaproteobacteria bacterium]|nr:PilT/PilU family type 4a pilus ATPase [Gammaproteobacteria bacterium]